MKIGLDVDDTITDSYIVGLKHTAEYYNMDFDELYNKGYSYQYMRTHDNEFPEYIKFIDENLKYMIEEIDAKENATEVINKLKEEGNEIIIITAREGARKGQTAASLEGFGIPFDNILEGVWNKGEVAKELGIDVFIDDSIMHCEQMDAQGIKAILFDAPYNREDTIHTRVKTWNEVYEILGKKSM